MTAAYPGIYSYNPGQDEVTQGQRRGGKTKRTLESFIVGADRNSFSRVDGAHGYVAAVFRPDVNEDSAKTFTAIVAVSARVDGSGDRRDAKLERLELIIVDDAALSLDDFMVDVDGGEYVAVEDIVRRLTVAKAESAAGVSLHALQEQTEARHIELSNYGDISWTLLTTASLLQGKLPNRGGVAEMDMKALVASWPRLERALVRAVGFLARQHIYDEARLPSAPVVAVIAACFDKIPEHGDADATPELVMLR